MAFMGNSIYPGSEPFLRLQRHGILNSLHLREGDALGEHKPLLYRKPIDICVPIDEGLPAVWKMHSLFNRGWRKQIFSCMKTYGLKVREIRDQDTPAIQEFFSRRYSPVMASEICSFDLFRIRNYGHGLILEDKSAAVQGTIFEIGYDTPEKTSYTIRLAIAEEFAGKNLGLMLMQYSCLLAMEQGSRVKRGIIQCENLPSLYVNLNKVGWICDRFEPHINGLGAFFHIALPLDPGGLTRNVISTERSISFVQQAEEHVSYKLLNCRDLYGIEEMYRDTDFKIVALLKGGMVSIEPSFLAIPAAHLRLETAP